MDNKLFFNYIAQQASKDFEQVEELIRDVLIQYNRTMCFYRDNATHVAPALCGLAPCKAIPSLSAIGYILETQIYERAEHGIRISEHRLVFH